MPITIITSNYRIKLYIVLKIIVVDIIVASEVTVRTISDSR